ncbi:MAG TPA: FAD:protein FMN transferase [Methylomirabilota bacterium]|nr:FAD:protein FMN transferase [Methylomirabilota bacterium]
MEIAAAGDRPGPVHAAIDAAFDAVAEVHRLMSFHEATSDVSRLNREAGTRAVTVHPWTHAVLRAALLLGERSGGVFDVTVAPVLQRMGRLPGRPADPHAEAGNLGDRGPIALLPRQRVRFLGRDVTVDLGGIAKGFAVDRAIDTLKRHGMARGVVNAGGDLAAFGPADEMVSIRDPRAPGAQLCRVTVRDQALASSGGGPAAIVDPRSRAVPGTVRGASVLAPSCLVADALTKVVTIAGEAARPVLLRHGASALFVSAAGKVHVTADWAARVRRAS